MDTTALYGVSELWSSVGWRLVLYLCLTWNRYADLYWCFSKLTFNQTLFSTQINLGGSLVSQMQISRRGRKFWDTPSLASCFTGRFTIILSTSSGNTHYSYHLLNCFQYRRFLLRIQANGEIDKKKPKPAINWTTISRRNLNVLAVKSSGAEAMEQKFFKTVNSGETQVSTYADFWKVSNLRVFHQSTYIPEQRLAVYAKPLGVSGVRLSYYHLHWKCRIMNCGTWTNMRNYNRIIGTKRYGNLTNTNDIDWIKSDLKLKVTNGEHG